ncbi:MAG: Dabb family protein [Nitrospirae bacterium]|nr:Dabb family protein [Nitrospirota bacterium]MBI3393314.1 Dabb family protein [Nitrospirota bacterium]
MVTHIVLFKLTEFTPERVAEAKNVLLSMDGKIPQIRHLEAGTDVVRSPRSYDLALVAKFDSLEDLAAYQANPVHQDVVRYIRSVAASSVTVDYRA